MRPKSVAIIIAVVVVAIVVVSKPFVAPLLFTADLDHKPYHALSTPRNVDQFDLPDDLHDFYEQHEGVGLESSPDRLVRICTLSEVERVGWSDLHVMGDWEPLEGWEEFSAYRIGISSFFDEIVYVINAPSCQRGTIFATGMDLSGPGGDGPFVYDESIVLAASFEEWLNTLERCDWVDFGLYPGELDNLSPEEQFEMREYFKTLNPGIDWGPR